MNIESELNHKLFLQREENTRHPEFEKEIGLYKAIASGDLEEVKRRLKLNESWTDLTTSGERNGLLSQNPLQNRKFHFVIFAAMTTRFCVEFGLEHEKAYNMSDIFIQQADLCTTIEQLNALQTEMIRDFTLCMKDRQKQNTHSKLIAKCIDYIFDNLQKKLKTGDIADYLSISPSYLSRLFAKEMGMSLSSYIKSQRLNAAAQMLQYSDYSILEIAEYFEFSSQSHFTSAFQEKYKTTPKRYRDAFSEYIKPPNG